MKLRMCAEEMRQERGWVLKMRTKTLIEYGKINHEMDKIQHLLRKQVEHFKKNRNKKATL